MNNADDKQRREFYIFNQNNLIKRIIYRWVFLTFNYNFLFKFNIAIFMQFSIGFTSRLNG